MCIYSRGIDNHITNMINYPCQNIYYIPHLSLTG